LLAALALAASAPAQEWPVKPVKIIVPFPAGGSADLLPRIVGEKLSEMWRQPVIVENRPGAAGNIGATVVYQAEPDGYTLLSAPPPPLVINRLLYPKLAYDATKFVPMSVIAAIPNVLLVNPNVPARSLGELIAYAKANPGKLNYSSQGNGTTSHLTAELFKSMAGGLQITHVPYKGTAPALQALAGGEVSAISTVAADIGTLVRGGKARLLAVSGEKRMSAFPDVPTFRESGYDLVALPWYAMFAPTGTPQAAVDRYSQAAIAAMHDPALHARLEQMGLEPTGLGPQELASILKADYERWGPVIRASGFKPGQ
jgi:tripartite-type tricarboxylate transporter receptor subunit TctC